jgi:hypothetical protein
MSGLQRGPISEAKASINAGIFPLRITSTGCDTSAEMTVLWVEQNGRASREKQVPRCARNDSQKNNGSGKGKGKGKSKVKGKVKGKVKDKEEADSQGE